MNKTTPAIVALILITLFACVPNQPQVPEKAAAPGPSSQGGSSAIGEWDKLVAAARQEGLVMVYTDPTPALRDEMTQTFKQKYGVSLDFVMASGAELSQKLAVERRAGLYLDDVYLQGTSGTIATVKSTGALDPLKPILILPEATDEKAWFGGKLSFADREQNYIVLQSGSPTPGVIVNSELVKPGDLKSFRDILDPRWKGKIVMQDATTPGAGERWFRSVSELMGVDYMRELARQDLVITRDNRLRFEWVSHGKYSLTLGHSTPTYAEFTQAGAPIAAYYLQEGAWMTGRSSGLSLVNNAPHPNAAKLFINWLLTREGQTIYSKATSTQSLRLDVPTGHLKPEELRQQGAKYIMVENEEYLQKDPEYMELAKDIFKDVLK